MHIRRHSDPHFPAFGLNTERYLSFRIRSEWGKIRTGIPPNTDTFYAVTAEERFQTQSKNNLTLEHNTYKDITMNKMQNEEYHHYRNVGNSSIKTI